jgi:hypothetical protein
MFYNNFHVTRPSFWRRPEVLETLRAVDRHGGIFFGRWGDAPLQTLIAFLHAGPERVARYPFAYSKRLQREAAWPALHTYRQSGFITEDPRLRAMLQGRWIAPSLLGPLPTE